MHTECFTGMAGGRPNTPKLQRYGFGGKDVTEQLAADGITTLGTGVPYTIFSGVDSNLDGVPTDRPDTVGNPNPGGGRSRAQTVQEFFNTAAFAQVPANVSYGNTGRNSLIGPSVINTDSDFSVLRDLPMAHDSVLQFRSEPFNFFNNVNLQNPNNTLTNPLFGQISGSANARIVQFALKYKF
jgi:hypothetical protein